MADSGIPEQAAVLLVDNGSILPAATLSLRGIAAALGRKLGRDISPVSLLHSDRVPASELGDLPAETLEGALRRRLGLGCTDFLLLPLFFGPSGALAENLSSCLERLRARHPELSVRLASWIDAKGDPRLGRVLEDHVREVLATGFSRRPDVVLVDHGSPVRAVAGLRDRLARELAGRLGPSVGSVAPASMERRPGPEYAFNEPLLENALERVADAGGDVVLSLLFLSPGRHAGPGGDIDDICAAAVRRHPHLRIRRTALVGVHPGLIDILADRARGPHRLL